MLSPTLSAAWRKGYEQVIETLGVPAQYEVALTGVVTAIPQVGFVTLGKDNDQLIQAYGVGAKVITIKSTSLTAEPVKFDRVTINNEVNVIDAVHPVHLPGTGVVIAHRCYVRGK